MASAAHPDRYSRAFESHEWSRLLNLLLLVDAVALGEPSYGRAELRASRAASEVDQAERGPSVRRAARANELGRYSELTERAS